MEATYFYVALAVGLAVSLLIEALTGISPGGMIVASYLALVCDDIPQVLLIFAISLVIYLIVNFVLPRFVVLFGRRKFMATLIVGLIIKLGLELLFPVLMPFSSIAFRGVGVITPCLLANCYGKQGIRYTIPAALVSSYATFGIITLLFWVF